MDTTVDGGFTSKNPDSKSYICRHCNESLLKTLYFRHWKLYYDKRIQRWNARRVMLPIATWAMISISVTKKLQMLIPVWEVSSVVESAQVVSFFKYVQLFAVCYRAFLRGVIHMYVSKVCNFRTYVYLMGDMYI